MYFLAQNIVFCQITHQISFCKFSGEAYNVCYQEKVDDEANNETDGMDISGCEFLDETEDSA